MFLCYNFYIDGNIPFQVLELNISLEDPKEMHVDLPS